MDRFASLVTPRSGYRLLLALILLCGLCRPVAAWQWHGFVDARSGQRLQEDDGQRQAILNEARAQLALSHSGRSVLWQLRSDFVLDEAAGEQQLDLESGHGCIDLREANLLFSPHDSVDIKLGRQILTWGTGDLLFINDLFPKDWQSFFIGRDEEYLKAPSDAIFISFFPRFANIDMVYVPGFDADRYISGERLSYWNPLLGRLANRDDGLRVAQRHHWFEEDEISVRVSQDVGGYELALYAYDGYWKSPVGYDPAAQQQTFPRLRVFGGSGRGNLGAGIAHLELGYYDSVDDADGSDPWLANSEYRVLAGYEQEVARDLSLAVQYYLEYMADYAAYRRYLPAASPVRDRDRHVLTVRVTRQAFNQNLHLSLFSYWSPSDRDGYLRPTLKYKASDELSLYVGANLFFGQQSSTFFGQFKNNNNLYLGVRYSF